MPTPRAASKAENRKTVNAKEGATYQACIHTEPLKRTQNGFDYKLHIMELAMEWAEENWQLEHWQRYICFNKNAFSLSIHVAWKLTLSWMTPNSISS
jgi:hypothetical protein